jgi:L-aspartate oxidase
VEPELAFDVLVVGAGIAGLVAALDILDAAPQTSVAVLDKGAAAASGSTPLAQGGLAAALDPTDSPARHAADTLTVGDGLCDPDAVAVATSEGPERVADLVARGVAFDRTTDGALALAREGGQTVARSARAADATGAAILRVLWEAASDRVTVLHGVACALATTRDRTARTVAGVWAGLAHSADPSAASDQGATDEAGGGPAAVTLVRARSVLLASGGCGGLYAATTNRSGATADGVALASRAGAALTDLEFVQFHPTALGVTSSDELGPVPDDFARPLLTEALRGAGAVLVDADGRRFMTAVHPEAELAPRHVVTEAILAQPGGVWLDARPLPAARWAEEFPTAVAAAAAHGYDLPNEPVPVEPAQHYLVGGVHTDLSGATSLPGLYAAGEVAATGVHGADRMAGNSLLQSAVFAHRAACAITEQLRSAAPSNPQPGTDDPPSQAPAGAAPPPELRDRVRRAMTASAGPVRSEASLKTAEKELRAVADAGATPGVGRAQAELANAVTAARLIVQSARLRAESRGAHRRADWPSTDPRWDGVRLRVTGEWA